MKRFSPDMSLEERLRLGSEDVGDCREWVRQKNGDYGTIRWQGRKITTHRAAYMVAHGPIPEGLSVLHKCDNPACIKIDHLFLGTCKDNVKDMVDKGRQKGGPANPRSKLTEQDVIDIRARRANGESLQSLSTAYKVGASTIVRIERRITWSHVK